jgi:eukaryotic-like serine/threonine-protein kinase
MLTPGTQFGRYVVKRKLAEGGMAEIYLAQSVGAEGFSKDVVLKLVRAFLASDQQFIDMFIAEARLVSKLNHANVVQIFDFGKQDDTYYLAMEFVHGASLYDLRRKTKQIGMPFPPTLAAEICGQVARGLQYAHSLSEGGKKVGVVHRDVTPHNVLMSYDGAVKLTDFGIAKASSSHTAPGILKGKFAYMSPEQSRGDPVDARTDVFALGIVLWELLTGGRLFDGDSEIQVLRAVQESQIAPPERLNPDVNKDLSDIVMKALSRNLPERFQSAFEFEKALANFVLRNANSVEETSVGDFMHAVFKDDVAAALRQESEIKTAVPAPAHDDFGTGGTLAVNRDKQHSQKINPAQTMTKTPVGMVPDRATPSGKRRGVMDDDDAADPIAKKTESFEPVVRGTETHEAVVRVSRRLSPIPVQDASVVVQSNVTDTNTIKEVLGDDELPTLPKSKWPMIGAVLVLAFVGAVVSYIALRPSTGDAFASPAEPKAETVKVPIAAVEPKAVEVKPTTLAPTDATPDTLKPVAPIETTKLVETPTGKIPDLVAVKPPDVKVQLEPVVNKPVAVKASPSPVNPPVAKGTGIVLIKAKPWAKVSIDGAPGKDVEASAKRTLSVGKHRFIFVHPKKTETKEVVVLANESVTVSFDAAE